MAERDLIAGLRLLAQLQPALARHERARVADIVGQLIAMRAPLGGQWRQVAQVAAEIGERRLSRQAIDLFADAAGGTHAAQYQKAAFLAESGAVREAEALLRALPEDVPNPLANAYSRGIAALNLGRPDEARRYLEQVTREQPRAGPAWLGLAMTVDFAHEPDLAARVVAAEAGMAGADPSHAAAYAYALGKVHADRGEHSQAFAAFARGARQMKAVAGYDRAADAADAAEAVRDHDAARLAALAARQGEPTARTIFVNGLPRSGTTLVEQILTAHSAVGDGAEIEALPLLASETGGRSHAALARFVEAAGAEPAARLWHRWLDERFGERGRIVDKSVSTSRYLGLAAGLLPQAPLIWLTRDPLDRAWSCFRTNFLGGAQPWSYDLSDIACHFRLEDRLLAQWSEMLGERLLVVPYEALTAEPEAWIRRILAHCGLAEEPQAFAPHENARAVATASMLQVRRPIDSAGIGAAEAYRAFLQPFIDAYYG